MTVLTDLYSILFGKNHITDGDVISMSEHGRQGGVASRQGFKFTDRVQLRMLMATNASLTFIGHAAPDINATLPDWRIKAIATGKGVAFADSSDEFDKVWELRTTYAYSFE